MTVSNIVSPLMNNLDRFLLGMLIPVSMVSYYTTPAEIVNKLAFIPEGIVSVVFPAVVASFAGDRLHASTMYGRGYKLVFLLLLIPIALLFLLGQDILSHWVNPVFAEKAAPALKVLAVGLWINGLARVAFNVIQGAGRPDVTAKIHLVEILPFLTLFYLMVQEYGYLGAAISWMLRVVLDAVIMFNVANRFTPLPITTRQHVFSLLLVLLLWPATMIESTGLMVHAILASLIIVTVVAASAYNFLGWLGLSRIFKF